MTPVVFVFLVPPKMVTVGYFTGCLFSFPGKAEGVKLGVRFSTLRGDRKSAQPRNQEQPAALLFWATFVTSVAFLMQLLGFAKIRRRVGNRASRVPPAKPVVVSERYCSRLNSRPRLRLGFRPAGFSSTPKPESDPAQPLPELLHYSNRETRGTPPSLPAASSAGALAVSGPGSQVSW